MPLPDVITAGFANSGTSFLTELVASMGFSPGSSRLLKMGDGHNRYGYWEHLPMRAVEWQRGRFDERKIPSVPYPSHDRISRDIAELARTDNIEVYKATTLPWTYRWFSAGRAVLIRRSADTLYERYYEGVGWSLNGFRAAHAKYYDLAAKHLDAEWDVLWLEYESFADNLTASITAVCEFLGRPFTQSLLHIWRPR